MREVSLHGGIFPVVRWKDRKRVGEAELPSGGWVGIPVSLGRHPVGILSAVRCHWVHSLAFAVRWHVACSLEGLCLRGKILFFLCNDGRMTGIQPRLSWHK